MDLTRGGRNKSKKQIPLVVGEKTGGGRGFFGVQSSRFKVRGSRFV
jgi:hypothetical protein